MHSYINDEHLDFLITEPQTSLAFTQSTIHPMCFASQRNARIGDERSIWFGTTIVFSQLLRNHSNTVCHVH